MSGVIELRHSPENLERPDYLVEQSNSQDNFFDVFKRDFFLECDALSSLYYFGFLHYRFTIGNSIDESQSCEPLRRRPFLHSMICCLLERELQGGDPSLERVAVQLGLSARTLQRKLHEQNTSDNELLDQMRHELALGI